VGRKSGQGGIKTGQATSSPQLSVAQKTWHEYWLQKVLLTQFKPTRKENKNGSKKK
jgi:hypothetical protein